MPSTGCFGRAQHLARLFSVACSLAIASGLDTKSSGETLNGIFAVCLRAFLRACCTNFLAILQCASHLKTHAGPSSGTYALWGSHGRLSNHVQKEALRSTELDFWLIKHPEFQRVTSQGVQDGALEHIFNHVGTTNKYYVVRNACTRSGLSCSYVLSPRIQCVAGESNATATKRDELL